MRLVEYLKMHFTFPKAEHCVEDVSFIALTHPMLMLLSPKAQGPNDF